MRTPTQGEGTQIQAPNCIPHAYPGLNYREEDGIGKEAYEDQQQEPRRRLYEVGQRRVSNSKDKTRRKQRPSWKQRAKTLHTTYGTAKANHSKIQPGKRCRYPRQASHSGREATSKVVKIKKGAKIGDSGKGERQGTERREKEKKETLTNSGTEV